LITIKRTKRSIAIDGRPNAREVTAHAASIGANNRGSSSSRSSPASSSGNSATSTGSPRSNNDSACPPDNVNIKPPNPPDLQAEFSQPDRTEPPSTTPTISGGSN